jgi:hypothetical protein
MSVRTADCVRKEEGRHGREEEERGETSASAQTHHVRADASWVGTDASV